MHSKTIIYKLGICLTSVAAMQLGVTVVSFGQAEEPIRRKLSGKAPCQPTLRAVLPVFRRCPQLTTPGYDAGRDLYGNPVR